MATACWTTRDGRKIPIGDMTDAHLLNAIRMVRRTFDREMLAACAIAGKFDPEGMAADCIDREIQVMEDAGPRAVCREYDALADEAGRRGLDLE